MGGSDNLIHPQQMYFIKKLIEENVINTKKISSIAYLGNPMENNTVKYCKKAFFNARHDLYDIQLKNWELNNSWDIENYDLVICYRTSCYVDNLNNFILELKKCVSKNKFVIFNFTLRECLIENFPAKNKTQPANINARFDFRYLYRGTPEKYQILVNDSQDLPHLGNKRREYFEGNIDNALTTKMLYDSALMPTGFITMLNPAGRHMVNTYMFWDRENIPTSDMFLCHFNIDEFYLCRKNNQG